MFQVEFEGFRDGPVGPHPLANAQVIFKPEQFQPVVEWLMFHRDDLDVLIHLLTDDSVDDHSIYAMWGFGSPVPLKLKYPRRTAAERQRLSRRQPIPGRCLNFDAACLHRNFWGDERRCR